LNTTNDRFAQIPDAEIAAPRVLEQIQRCYELHAGELAALALALQNPGAILLTDDSAARLAAQTLQLTVHGTIGVLLRSLRRQQRTKAQVLALLRELLVRSTRLNAHLRYCQEEATVKDGICP
jgi:predicted nucleic acid-binding protein